jgi:hypothetical protein
MYADHVPVIAGAMRADVGTFKRGVMFAILSARVPFHRVPDQCSELKKRGRDAACLWNWKFDAYCYLEDHAADLHSAACGTNDAGGCIRALCQIPGLGIVKGAFVAQMLGHDVACLDARNIAREGRNPRAFRTDGVKTGAAFSAKVDRYLAETYGRAAELWDTWCNEVGPDYGMTAQQASELHLTSIVPKRLRHLTFTPHRASSTAIPF